MRNYLSVVILVILAGGCVENQSGLSEAGSTVLPMPPSQFDVVTDEPAPQVIADSSIVVSANNSTPLPGEQPAESAKPKIYPENTEVERLLVRAGEFQQQGEFEKALTLVKRALQLDPNSPSATTMRTSLEDLMRKI